MQAITPFSLKLFTDFYQKYEIDNDFPLKKYLHKKLVALQFFFQFFLDKLFIFGNRKICKNRDVCS